MTKTNIFHQAIFTLAIGLFAMPALSQTSTPQAEAPTKEQRESMAKSHEKMAACLRSDKAMDQCHEEMRMACESHGQGCGMGMMGMKHGHDHAHGKKGTGKK